MTTTAIRTIGVLQAGDFLKGEGFDRAFRLSTVQGFTRDNRAEDPQVAYDRAVRLGHETAWCINPGTSLTDEPMAVKQAKLAQERADFAAAIVVRTGEVYLIEGIAQRCTVNGPRFSDPIVFRPVR